MAGPKRSSPGGRDPNSADNQFSDEKKEADLRFSAKMALVVRDMMRGNPALAQQGFDEESLGYNAIAAGIQGQREWTDHYPSADFTDIVLNSSFDWNGIREPLLVATENDYLNAVTMVFGHLLTGTAQIFEDVRAYWSPESVERITGKKPTGDMKEGFIHLANSGPTAMDGCGRHDLGGKRGIKPHFELTTADVQANLDACTFHPGPAGEFRAGA